MYEAALRRRDTKSETFVREFLIWEEVEEKDEAKGTEEDFESEVMLLLIRVDTDLESIDKMAALCVVR